MQCEMTDHDSEIPASRLMRERDQARTEAAERMRRQLDAEADSARLRQRILDVRAENDRLAERLDAAIAREVAAYDRANVIPRERDVAQQAANGLADRCRRAESQLAELQAERLDHWREVKAQARDAAAAEVADQVARLRSLVQLAEATAEDYRSQLCEILAGDAGEDCPECSGTGERVDEIPDEFGTQIHRGGCTECFDGRIAREGLR